MQRSRSSEHSNDSAPVKDGSGKKEAKKKANMTAGGSILQTILLVGLLMCGTSLLYMMTVLERNHDGHGGVRRHHHHKHHHKTPYLDKSMKKKLGAMKKDMAMKLKAKEAAKDEDDKSNYINNKEHHEKDRILELARNAGITYIDKETFDSLPTWKEVTDLYGDKPKFVGLETCQTFQNSGFKYDHFIGAAGNFNSGYNLLSDLLIENCHMQDRMDKFGEENKGVRRQVPWGKHAPPGDEAYRNKHKAVTGHVDPNSVFPVVTVRDPYTWMQSMCRNPYAARWIHSENCPNIVPTPKNRIDHPELAGKIAIPVGVEHPEFRREYDSMAHLWNEYNHEYQIDIGVPKLMVRYEDLLFHPRETIKQACECAGGTLNSEKDFTMISHNVKQKSRRSGGYLEAMMNHGRFENRFSGFTPHDLKYINSNLDTKIMDSFGYSFYPVEKLLKTVKDLKEEARKKQKKKGVRGPDGEEHEMEHLGKKKGQSVKDIMKKEEEEFRGDEQEEDSGSESGDGSGSGSGSGDGSGSGSGSRDGNFDVLSH